MSPKKFPTSPWHTLEAGEVFDRLDAQADGLTEREAQERLAKYGPNRLRPPHRRGPLLRLLGQFHNVLIYVLLGAALITALLGHWVDTSVILGVVMVNALIGFIQEGKAERALEAVRNMLSLQATVLREGKRQTIAAEELVPGDIVILQSGDKVPADLRLFRVKDLRSMKRSAAGLPWPSWSSPWLPSPSASWFATTLSGRCSSPRWAWPWRRSRRGCLPF